MVGHSMDHSFMDLGYQNFGECPVMSGGIMDIEVV